MATARLHSASLLIISAIAFHDVQSLAQTIAFQMDENIAVADLSAGKLAPRKLTAGSDPCISPDGTQVAFTHNDADGNRHIAVADVATGKWKRIKGIPGDNSYLPIWSPDGKTLFFNYFLESDWALASVDPAGGGFRVFDKLESRPGAYGWFPDGKSLLCHNLESFFVLTFDETGATTRRDVPKTGDLTGLSVPSRIAVAPDGKSALFELLIDADAGPDDEGPPSAVFLLQLESGQMKRVTPKGFNASCPAWLPDAKEFLFSAFDVKTARPSIYRAPADGSAAPALILKGADCPTVAGQK